MKRIDSGLENYVQTVYYLPHHAGLKETSTTIRLRVVFDGSARLSNNVALNDLLLTAPVVQQDLISIITRFRMHAYVVVADIAKMYRQVRIDTQQQHLHRILWRDNPEDEVHTYELVTLTYGTTPATYLTTRCFIQLANDNSTLLSRGRSCQKGFLC